MSVKHNGTIQPPKNLKAALDQLRNFWIFPQQTQVGVISSVWGNLLH